MNKNQAPHYVGNHKIIKTNDGMVIQQDDKIHTLNYTACEIYELCDSYNSIDDIIEEMKCRYPDDDIEELIEGIFIQFMESGLIEMSNVKD